MTPQDAIAEGRLSDAVALQEAIVNDCPHDPAARLFFYELLSLAGRLNDARDQLHAIESTDPTWPATRRGFAWLLKAESARRRGRRTEFGPDPPSHLKARWRVFRALALGRPDEALLWVDRSDASCPTIAGHVDGREFEGLRDTDDRFGSVLEAFVGPAYVWIPFEDLRRITFAATAGVLDAAFRRARLRFADGQEIEATLPLLYPGSFAADGVFAVGLEADWPDVGGPVCGVGARVMLVGDEELPLSECRQFDLHVVSV